MNDFKRKEEKKYSTFTMSSSEKERKIKEKKSPLGSESRFVGLGAQRLDHITTEQRLNYIISTLIRVKMRGSVAKSIVSVLMFHERTPNAKQQNSDFIM